MIIHPQIDPIAFRLFGWPVYWYGIMYLLAFCWFFFMGWRFLQTPAFAYLRRRIVMEDLTVAGLLGVIVGGRLGYVLFYNASFYISHPTQIFYIWDGGMSFHGGLIGVMLAVLAYARLSGSTFLRLIDFVAVLVPVGLGLGRIGNFINGELPGRVVSSDLPWAMVFPQIDSSLRHPSPIYQALLEGVVLAAVMLWLAKRRRPPGFLVGTFLIGYGLARFFSEQFREPDAHIGFLIGGFTMGQLLSLPMLLLGIIFIFNKRINQTLSTMGEKKIATSSDNWNNSESFNLQEKSDVPPSTVSPLTTINKKHQKTKAPTDDWNAPQSNMEEAVEHKSLSWFSALFGDDEDNDEDDGRISRRYKRRLRKKQRS